MLRPTATSLASILPKTVRSCLSSAPPLPYNWDGKFRELVMGICLSRSLVLQNIAQTKPDRVKTTENTLSKFLGEKRLDLYEPTRSGVITTLKRLRRRRLWRHAGKAVLIIDATSYPKARSRGKLRPLPAKGQVCLHNLPTKAKLLVPGYQEIWIGLLLSDRTVLPLSRRLWSEKGPSCSSLNIVEEVEIAKAKRMVAEAFQLNVILVADRGFRRKDLLHELKKTERMDYVIRLDGKLTVTVDGVKGLLHAIAPLWPHRLIMQWRGGSKRALLSRVSSRRVCVEDSSAKSFCFNAVCLTPEREAVEPMFLATTLTTGTNADLMAIVKLYSWRWGIETFFWMFKRGLKGSSWRVFSCWEAIDHLLAAAHMAYLVLALIAELARQGRREAMRRLRRQVEMVLRSRFARPPEFTLGRLFQILAMDFPNPREAGALP